MREALATYLNDHLGGAQIALQLLEAMRDQNGEERFRDFARALLPEIEADDQTLRSITEQVGSGPSVIKQAGGWLLEKAARFKLGHTGSADFDMFESLELLVLGIHGKLCLWRALRAASELDPILRSYDFEVLIRRASEQYDRAERERIDLVRMLWAPVIGH